MSEPREERIVADRVRCYPRAVAMISAVVVLGVIAFSLVMWFALPASLRATFTIFQLITLLAVLVVVVVLLAATSASMVDADADRLRLRNGLRSHTYEWSDIRRIDFGPGDPWAFVWLGPDVDHPEGVRRLVLGVQRSDGLRADRAVAGLRALHRQATLGPR